MRSVTDDINEETGTAVGTFDDCVACSWGSKYVGRTRSAADHFMRYL